MDRLLQILAEQGVVLEKIWVPHGHADHAGGVQALREATGALVEGPHEADRFWIERIPTDALRWGMAGQDFEPDRWLVDGDTVTVGDMTFEVIHCPGHTPGHVVFFNRATRFAQVGDVLFKGSIGRTDFPRGDHAALIAAITEKLWPLGPDVQFVPGHGPMSTFGAERASNAFVADKILAQG